MNSLKIYTYFPKDVYSAKQGYNKLFLTGIINYCNSGINVVRLGTVNGLNSLNY